MGRNRPPAPPELPWTIGAAGVNTPEIAEQIAAGDVGSVLDDIEARAFEIFMDVLNVPRARKYSIRSSGQILPEDGPAESRVTQERIISRTLAYSLPETILRLGVSHPKVARLLTGEGNQTLCLNAGAVLFVLSETRDTLKDDKGSPQYTAECLIRLFVNATAIGWSFDKRVPWLAQKDRESRIGATKGAKEKAAGLRSRDEAIRECLATKMTAGVSYGSAIAGLARNWPEQFGKPLSTSTLRNKFPKKSFPEAGQTGKGRC